MYPVPDDLRAATGEEGLEGGVGVGAGPVGVVEIGAGVGGIVAALDEPGGVDGRWLAEVGGVPRSGSGGKARRASRRGAQ